MLPPGAAATLASCWQLLVTMAWRVRGFRLRGSTCLKHSVSALWMPLQIEAQRVCSGGRGCNVGVQHSCQWHEVHCTGCVISGGDVPQWPALIDGVASVVNGGECSTPSWCCAPSLLGPLTQHPVVAVRQQCGSECAAVLPSGQSCAPSWRAAWNFEMQCYGVEGCIACGHSWPQSHSAGESGRWPGSTQPGGCAHGGATPEAPFGGINEISASTCFLPGRIEWAVD